MLAQLGYDADQPVQDNPFYKQAEAAVDSAQRDLNDTVVRAPFDGVVTNVDSLQVGSYLRASQPGFSLVSDTNLWVEASPKETELTYVRPGQAATVTVDTYPGVAWIGTVESISPGLRLLLLPAAGPEHHGQLGKSGAAHPDARAARPASGQATAAGGNERSGGRRHRTRPRLADGAAGLAGPGAWPCLAPRCRACRPTLRRGGSPIAGRSPLA